MHSRFCGGETGSITVAFDPRVIRREGQGIWYATAIDVIASEAIHGSSRGWIASMRSQ
jgi:hypothetical protein